MAGGDQWRMLRFRDACLATGGLSFYVGEIFDALVNDDLETAQRAAAAYVNEWHESRRNRRTGPERQGRK